MVKKPTDRHFFYYENAFVWFNYHLLFQNLHRMSVNRSILIAFMNHDDKNVACAKVNGKLSDMLSWAVRWVTYLCGFETRYPFCFSFKKNFREKICVRFSDVATALSNGLWWAGASWIAIPNLEMNGLLLEEIFEGKPETVQFWNSVCS